MLFLPLFCCLWYHDDSCPFCKNLNYYLLLSFIVLLFGSGSQYHFRGSDSLMFEEKVVGEKVAKLYIKMDSVDNILGVGEIEGE